ncbi:hypothetical protein [Actinocatenispora comari]|uniref:Uncharacterized protein n=1 Tax=Actinocatenispora comari TaxID=2807577 RepID=A0A8J4EIZ2_9ACTN|nr:hypothetical protein [Actinocatenispora comari]GIL25480.1 hypothetical protein NUM_07350 [Actinocatenispora comari]
MYTALIHRPGCLPDTTEPPPEFDTPAEAWHYIAEQRAAEDRDLAEPCDTACGADTEHSSTYQQLAHCANRPAPTAGWDGTGTIHGPTPGADTLGDVGWCYTVEAVTAPPDCQAPGHDHRAHDANGTPTTGPSRCPQCRALCHFDERVGDYQHDGPTIPDCFLIRRHPAAVPCLRPGTDLDTTPSSTGLPRNAAAPTHAEQPLRRIRWTRSYLVRLRQDYLAAIPNTLAEAMRAGTDPTSPDIDDYVCGNGKLISETWQNVDDDELSYGGEFLADGVDTPGEQAP